MFPFKPTSGNIATMDMITDKYARTGESVFAAIALTILSDFLLFDGNFGLSLVLLGLAGAIVALLINRSCSRQRLVLGAVIYTLALLPILENISMLSVSVFLAASAIGTLVISDDLRWNVSDGIWRLGRFLLSIPLRSSIDIVRWRKAANALGTPALRFARFAVWTMPLVIGLVFLALFEDANPIIAALIAKIDLWFLFELLDIDRVLFWIVMFVLIWPFLSARLPSRKVKPDTDAKVQKPAANMSGETLESILFGPAAILRSLLVFNALFAVQSILDAAYLIGGVALPEGMTYAQYAHRGAYPLIITALLAAVFVLIALREGSAARDSILIRGLVYAWVAQNILLVLSSILRLDLYVASYGLTYWRISAFVWMALVAVGLFAIIWRIWANKTAEWLVGVNLATSALVIYIACFVNVAGVIANYNVGIKQRDFWYVTRIGPHVLPAIDKAIRAGEGSEQRYYHDAYDEPVNLTLAGWRNQSANAFLRDNAEWRSWSLRGWRLKRYLDKNPFVNSGTLPTKNLLKSPETRR